MAQVGFEPRLCWSQAWRFNHSTTLPTNLSQFALHFLLHILSYPGQLIPFHQLGNNQMQQTLRITFLLSPHLSHFLHFQTLPKNGSWTTQLFSGIHNILLPMQTGFRPGRSTVDQVLLNSQSITDYFRKSKPGACTVFNTADFAKAFDSVWHSVFLFKLLSLGFPLCFVK